MNLALWLHRAGLAQPGLSAVGHGENTIRTYGVFAGRVARLAAGLRQRLRLAIGDRVVIASRNSPDYLDLLYAIWHAGLVAVPVDAKLHGRELGYILAHSGARACFASDRLHGDIAAHAPPNLEHLIVIGGRDYRELTSADAMAVEPRAGEDPAWLFYTSGMTGRPKGATLTHRALAAMSHAYLAEVDAVAPGDPILHGAPMSHGSGLSVVPHVMRLAVNVLPESGAFDADEIVRLIDVWPRAGMFAAPTMLNRLVACPRDCDPGNIRLIVWGGAPLYVEDALAAVGRFGPRLAQVYGQGECPMTITTLSRDDIARRDHPRWRTRLASAGRPFASIEVRIVDPNDVDVAPGEIGEIVCRGDTVMAGYWDDPAASAQTLRGGWLHTGDVGSLDSDGYLILKDQSRDLIISGGSNIYPREVEEVLLKHPGVREAAVIGRGDREWGEIVVAYVAGAASAEELDALCLDHIARFKRPRDYVFLDALPRNNYGKIPKTILRDIDAQRSDATG